MDVVNPNDKVPWGELLREHAQAHPYTALGLVVSLLAVLGLLLVSVVRIAQGEAEATVQLALIGGMGAFAATALGAVPGALLRSLPQRVEDSLLGLAAGMMLAAGSFSLLLPGLEAGEQVMGSGGLGAAVVVLGMALGVLLMLGLDQFTPHEHVSHGRCGPGCERVGRIWLFVLAIALHNLPEGMAIGVGFTEGDMSIGLPLTIAIALQDIPEGLVVVMVLRSAGISPWRAVMVAALTGLMEPAGALIGIALSSGLAVAYPIGLGLAAGAMIFVVSHEVIPETHRNGHQTPATIGLMAGFAIMMTLDVTLG